MAAPLYQLRGAGPAPEELLGATRHGDPGPASPARPRHTQIKNYLTALSSGFPAPTPRATHSVHGHQDKVGGEAEVLTATSAPRRRRSRGRGARQPLPASPSLTVPSNWVPVAGAVTVGSAHHRFGKGGVATALARLLGAFPQENSLAKLGGSGHVPAPLCLQRLCVLGFLKFLKFFYSGNFNLKQTEANVRKY